MEIVIQTYGDCDTNLWRLWYKLYGYDMTHKKMSDKDTISRDNNLQFFFQLIV